MTKIKKIISPVNFDRIIAKEHLLHYLFAILILPLLIAGIGAIGQYICTLFCMQHFYALPKDGILWEAYENFINFNGQNGYSFSHRLFLLITGIFGVFLLNGILVSAIVSWVEKRSERWKSGELRYDVKRWFQCSFALDNYVVVIGGNEMVPELVKQILSDDNLSYVLVMTNRNVQSLRKTFVSLLGKNEEKVVIYHGERTLKEDLSHLQIERAKKIYVIGEQLDIDQSGSHHDVKNMECVKLMSQLLGGNEVYLNDIKSSKQPILCRVMFEYQSSFSVFQFTDVDSDISSVLDFRPFNYYETWAQNVFICPTLKVDVEKDNYLPLEGCDPITKDSKDTVHLIVVGMSRMGIAMAMEAAHIAHYPNFIHNRTDNLRTRITFIDSIAKKEMQYIQGHYKELFSLSRWRYIEANNDSIYYNESGHIPYDTNDKSWKNPLIDSDSHSPYRDNSEYTLGEKVVDVDWEFIKGDLEMPAVQCYIRDAAMQQNVRLTIAICFPKDNASFAASLYLPDEVYEEKNNVVQVLAYQPYGDAMCQSFKKRVEMKGCSPSNHRNNFNQFAKLKAFGMMSSCYNISQQKKMELAANQIWNQYDKTYNGRIGGRNDLRKALGKPVSLKAGKSLAACQWSNTYAAAHLWTKLRSIKWDGESEIDDDSKHILAKLEHIRWNVEQLLLGYAPLRPEEQMSIKGKIKKACKVTFPYDELLQISTMGKVIINKENFQKLNKWLDAWKEFDEEREILKANMSHIDLCSFEILEEIDKEAVQYDKDLTSILPLIYSNIKGIHN